MDPVSFAYAVSSIAQDVSGQGSSFLIDLFTNIGMAGVFIFLYLDERKERREAQRLNNQLLERALPLLAESATALERVQESQSAIHQADQIELAKQLRELTTELRRDKGDAR